MKWIIVIAIAALSVVILIGLVVTDFTAYLGNNPSTCNNCHVMDAAYEGWYHAGHRAWANCNDCHTPHALILKYIIKAESGYHHVRAFIFGNIPIAIRAKTKSKDIVQDNCIRCHESAISMLLEASMPLDRYCSDCHRAIAHGERGISLLPYQHLEESR